MLGNSEKQGGWFEGHTDLHRPGGQSRANLRICLAGQWLHVLSITCIWGLHYLVTPDGYSHPLGVSRAPYTLLAHDFAREADDWELGGWLLEPGWLGSNLAASLA